MPDALPIYLVGPRACGKTTAGRLLAERLGREFVDTDELLVARFGGSIAEFVAAHGWEAFRDEESAVLELLAANAAAGARAGMLVVSCGGGIVLRSRNREILTAGRTLYLHAAPEVLAARLTADPLEAQRPSLTGKSATEEVREVLASREPRYREVARAVLDGCAPLEAVVRQAMEVAGD